VQHQDDEEVNFNDKDDLSNEFAKCYWYVLPKEWPPADYNYQPVLKANGFRSVDISRWKIEPEEDSSGLKKVFEIENFRGVFKDT
jgi:hypothetical protein